ncbi:hypothetical protein CK203_004629 [Vitis vinifera]|uniref:Uncharacterized protein n=1 Tax=Vitis vinifera TaxID=29760 RepID=A0A438KFX3_VITVI|nr:hypothetical protein CK203_004629 [Vitis vinifera]
MVLRWDWIQQISCLVRTRGRSHATPRGLFLAAFSAPLNSGTIAKSLSPSPDSSFCTPALLRISSPSDFLLYGGGSQTDVYSGAGRKREDREREESFRYTRAVLQSTLQLMGCKLVMRLRSGGLRSSVDCPGLADDSCLQGGSELHVMLL